MDKMIIIIKDLTSMLTISNIFDIAIVAFVVYKIIGWIKGTQAEQVAKGIVVLLIATQLSEFFGLHVINFILKNTFTVGFIALIIVFQPELRRALEHLGNTRFIGNKLFKNTSEIKQIVEEIVEAVEELSKEKIGALIVLENNTGLEDIVATGVKLDSLVTSELILNIFTPNRPLHDGAVIIGMNDSKLKAAGCLLPLTENKNISKSLGTRHRAGLGMTENSDAVVIIVSEETGVISYAFNGKLSRYLDSKSLKHFLLNQFIQEEQKESVLTKLWGNKNDQPKEKQKQ